MKTLVIAILSTIFLVGCASSRHPLDDQIIGDWRSNRKLTVPTIRYPEGAKPETIKKFEDIFGHLTVTYTKSESRLVMPAMNDFPEWRDKTNYKIVDRSEDSITIRYFDNAEKIEKSRKINFEGPNRYWIDLEQIEGREYFDRILN
jgi:hypothetical protein